MRIHKFLIVFLGFISSIKAQERLHMCKIRKSKYNITSPGFPSSYQGGFRMTYIIKKCKLACQLKIDLVQFTMALPDGDGNCNTDRFEVAFGTAVPNLCGENTGQHLYVNFIGNAPLEISFKLTGSSTAFRRWHLVLTQIPCLSHLRAPANCLQFYNTLAGVVKSFNYSPEANPNLNSQKISGSRQLAGITYSACIKNLLGICSITWFRLQSDSFSFTLSGDVDGLDPSLLGSGAVQSQICTTDFITISAPVQNGVTLQSTNFCGLGFLNTTSNTIPFILTVTTDSNENADISNRGFHLIYSQNACGLG